ncbi:MAG TPA: [protein-PII] uridylyltransferase [Blastocatellia bacterium]|nr:[protein-PII] uridylyltransferase [Blastocatellia bacterium]
MNSASDGKAETPESPLQEPGDGAAAQAAPGDPDRPEAWVKIKEELLSRLGFSGPQIVAARSLIADQLIQQVARATVENREAQASQASWIKKFAIVALGGYGRQELTPHSDLDLLFLHEGPPDAEEIALLAAEICQLLRDLSSSIGHRVLSLDECLSIAEEDRPSRNAMIDARLLWGRAELFETFNERLDKEVFKKRRRALIDELMSERTTRYQRFGEVACLQEPNVKETAGGLRDRQELWWAMRIAYGRKVKTKPEDLSTARIIPERDAKAIKASYGFLLRVRNELHLLRGRKIDLLSLDVQSELALNQQYEDTPHQQASDLFMRDYYLNARRVQRLCEAYLKQVAAGLEKKRAPSEASPASARDGFVLNDGTLDLKAPEPRPGLDGNRMMLAFERAQQAGASLSPAMQAAIQSGLPSVNRTFRSSPEGAQAFLKLLRAQGQVAFGLRLMHDLEFLGKFMPEFKRVTCLVQHDLYHRYTVDEHTLQTIRSLDELAVSRGKPLERYRKIYYEVEDPAILHLGLLLHDIGKGLGGEHPEKGVTIAERICERLHLTPAATQQVLFLIREHLKMSYISQRRDLTDEQVIRSFADLAGTLDQLNMLTLLTYGDLHGVGPGVWNEWKDSLLWDLYAKTRTILQPEAERERATELLRQRVLRMLASEVEAAEVRQHFQLLPEAYARLTPPSTIIEHIRLIHSLKSRLVKTSWQVDSQTHSTDLHLCSRNRRGLFATVTGSLTAMGVDLLSTHLNTRADGLAVDSFKVREISGNAIIDPARWEQIDNLIKRALNGEVDLPAAVAKRLLAHPGPRPEKRKPSAPVATVIIWDNQSSDKSTILEVKTGDRLGLVYTITSALTALGLDIAFAKVATEKHRALDIFYITDGAGDKLADAELPVIEKAIRTALDPKE